MVLQSQYGNLALRVSAESLYVLEQLSFIFLLKVLGWCTPDISGVPLGHCLRPLLAERSSFSLVFSFTFFFFV